MLNEEFYDYKRSGPKRKDQLVSKVISLKFALKYGVTLCATF